MAQAAQEGGAVAVRIAGVENLRAVRARVRVPIVGLIKREYAGFEPYITPTLEEARAVAASGAEIVAFDATPRARPDGSEPRDLIAQIHDESRLALADCATAADAAAAIAAGADIVATTLCGYTLDTAGTDAAGARSRARPRRAATFHALRGRDSFAGRRPGGIRGRRRTRSVSAAPSPMSTGSFASLQGRRSEILKTVS